MAVGEALEGAGEALIGTLSPEEPKFSMRTSGVSFPYEGSCVNRSFQEYPGAVEFNRFSLPFGSAAGVRDAVRAAFRFLR